MSDDTRQTFTRDLPSDIADGLNPSRYDNVWRRFKNAWNNFWNGLKTNISLNANFSAGGGYGRRRRSAEVVELKVEYSILVNCQD